MAFGMNTLISWLRVKDNGNVTSLLPVHYAKIISTISLSPQGIAKKALTLMLRNVKVQDAGIYFCKVEQNDMPGLHRVFVSVRSKL